jgi:hypothetical protein
MSTASPGLDEADTAKVQQIVTYVAKGGVMCDMFWSCVRSRVVRIPGCHDAIVERVKPQSGTSKVM